MKKLIIAPLHGSRGPWSFVVQDLEEREMERRGTLGLLCSTIHLPLKKKKKNSGRRRKYESLTADLYTLSIPLVPNGLPLDY